MNREGQKRLATSIARSLLYRTLVLAAFWVFIGVAGCDSLPYPFGPDYRPSQEVIPVAPRPPSPCRALAVEVTTLDLGQHEVGVTIPDTDLVAAAGATCGEDGSEGTTAINCEVVLEPIPGLSLERCKLSGALINTGAQSMEIEFTSPQGTASRPVTVVAEGVSAR